MRKRWAISVTVGALTLVLMLLAGSASATNLTSPTGTVATPTIKAASEGHFVIDSPEFPPKIQCGLAFEGTVQAHGKNERAVTGLNSLTLTGCTNSWHVTVVSPGSLEVQWTNSYNGIVFWTGATFEATRFGFVCRFSTNETELGTITGGSPATVDLEGSLPFHSGSPLCGSEPEVTGDYKLTSPGSLYVDDDDPEPGTTLTSPTGTDATPTIEAESEGYVTLDHPIANIQCQWAFRGTNSSHGPEEEAKIPLSNLSTTGCTESWHGTTVAAGELAIDRTSGYDGKVTWSGGTVEMTRLGTTCRYKTENTTLGTLTGGSPATIDIEAKLPFHSGSPLCGEEAYSLTGSLELTGPGSLYVDG